MKKDSRTNIIDLIIDKTVRYILPSIVVILFLFTGEMSVTAQRVLKLSLMIASPVQAFETYKDKEKSENVQVQTDKLTENALNTESTEVFSRSPQITDIPEDISNLIKSAETLYKNSSNDGIIIEEDYSQKNSTSVFNNVYVRNTTKNHAVDIEDYLKRVVQIKIEKNEPTVLIYHTHTTETYELIDRGFYTKERSSRSENSAENMIRIGEEICKVLEEKGYKTIHDKTVYDEQYSGAYDRSRETITKILKENPSIQVVLDIHRDAIYQKEGSRIKPTAVINGVKSAQIMIISGCEDGNVTNFPNWEKNLTFALKLQNKLSKDNPSLMRPLMFCSRKYNMDLMPCSLLVEFGSDANTLWEAVYSARLFAQSLSALLKEL